MKQVSITKLVFISLMVVGFFFWGIFLENIYEPYVGAVIATVIYLFLLSGRAPQKLRAVACFLMSWGLFFFARHLHMELLDFETPLRELDAELPLTQVKVVFGYKVQTVISVIIAVLAYFVGKNKLVTMES